MGQQLRWLPGAGLRQSDNLTLPQIFQEEKARRGRRAEVLASLAEHTLPTEQLQLLQSSATMGQRETMKQRLRRELRLLRARVARPGDAAVAELFRARPSAGGEGSGGGGGAGDEDRVMGAGEEGPAVDDDDDDGDCGRSDGDGFHSRTTSGPLAEASAPAAEPSASVPSASAGPHPPPPGLRPSAMPAIRAGGQASTTSSAPRATAMAGVSFADLLARAGGGASGRKRKQGGQLAASALQQDGGQEEERAGARIEQQRALRRRENEAVKSVAQQAAAELGPEVAALRAAADAEEGPGDDGARAAALDPLAAGKPLFVDLKRVGGR